MQEINALSTEDGPKELAEEIEMIQSDSAKIEFVLKAPLLHRYEVTKDSSYIEFPEGVHVRFFNDQGEENSSIKANYAINYEDEDKLVAKDNVQIINRNGDVLTGDDLWWDKQAKKIYSDKFVKIKTKDEVIYGKGLEANEDFTIYTILDIEGIISVSKSEFE